MISLNELSLILSLKTKNRARALTLLGSVDLRTGRLNIPSEEISKVTLSFGFQGLWIVGIHKLRLVLCIVGIDHDTVRLLYLSGHEPR